MPTQWFPWRDSNDWLLNGCDIIPCVQTPQWGTQGSQCFSQGPLQVQGSLGGCEVDRVCQALPLTVVRWTILEAMCPDPDCKAKLRSSVVGSRSPKWWLKPEALDPRVASQGPEPNRSQATRGGKRDWEMDQNQLFLPLDQSPWTHKGLWVLYNYLNGLFSFW